MTDLIQKINKVRGEVQMEASRNLAIVRDTTMTLEKWRAGGRNSSDTLRNDMEEVLKLIADYKGNSEIDQLGIYLAEDLNNMSKAKAQMVTTLLTRQPKEDIDHDFLSRLNKAKAELD